MRIVCPACETAYEVPDPVLVPGRALRCARCHNQWVPVSAALPEPMPDLQAPEPAARREAGPADIETPRVRIAAPPAADPPVPARAAVIAGWLASILLLGGLAYAAVTWRQPIERLWPPSIRAYALLGMP